MGEASASDKNNLSDRVAWSTYYFTKALESKIPVVLWDNMVTVDNGGNIESGECHGYYNRNENTWYFPTMIEAMMLAVYGEATKQWHYDVAAIVVYERISTKVTENDRSN